MVADIGAENPENHVFGDVGSMVGNTLKIARDQKRIQRLLSHFR